MNWPTHTDYQDAIQNPLICFAEEELKAGTAACDMLGLPRVTSGNFASVYELSAGGKRYAVRCFVRQIVKALPVNSGRQLGSEQVSIARKYCCQESLSLSHQCLNSPALILIQD